MDGIRTVGGRFFESSEWDGRICNRAHLRLIWHSLFVEALWLTWWPEMTKKSPFQPNKKQNTAIFAML